MGTPTDAFFWVSFKTAQQGSFKEYTRQMLIRGITFRFWELGWDVVCFGRVFLGGGGFERLGMRVSGMVPVSAGDVR